MEEPLVSVKMITYNHAPYIAKAIECVLRQKTNFPFELVIGEDCSTDGTREIVFEYQKKYPNIIRMITSDRNVGAGENSNRTTRALRGKYVAWCEGDDYWHNPKKLQKQVDYLESHPECGLVYSSYDVYHNDIKKLTKDFINYRGWQMPSEISITEILENKNGIGAGVLTCTIMTRATLFKKIIEADPYLHQEKHFLMGDTQLWSEISLVSKLHYIPESLATHRITEESASRSKDTAKQVRFSVSCGELSLYLCEKHNLPMGTRKIVENYWLDASMRLAFLTGDTGLADKLLVKKNIFSWKHWLKYLGIKSSMLFYILKTASTLNSLLKKHSTKWS